MAGHDSRRGRLRRWLSSARLRIVGWHVLLLALVLGLVIVSMQLILLNRLDERIDRELLQETEELRQLADGTDPETGEPFEGDVARILEVFLSRNIPARNETFVAFLDGQPVLRSFNDPALRLDLDEAAVSRWADLEEADRGRIHREGVGRIDYQAVPMLVDGVGEGVFVAAWFRDVEAQEIRETVVVVSVLSLFALLFAAGIVWNVTGRVLRPARVVAATARSITETDLTRRIDVSGSDEIAEIGETFNQMLDRLEAAFVAQREFIDDAGHELRTPITIIRGHLELLDLDDAADREATIALVTDELDRMHRMVEDLLVLAKAERPDFLDVGELEVHDLIVEVFDKVRGLADREWKLDELAEATVPGDRQRLTQALVQLAQNAVQHTEQGQRIAIGSAVVDGVASAVRLWVADSGRGVDPASLDRIFDRFARGVHEQRNGEGAGLGLAIVRAIAEAHDGEVTVSETPGGGATFTLTLPGARRAEQTTMLGTE